MMLCPECTMKTGSLYPMRTIGTVIDKDKSFSIYYVAFVSYCDICNGFWVKSSQGEYQRYNVKSALEVLDNLTTSTASEELNEIREKIKRE